LAGEDDQRPGQLVHALFASTAGERPDPAAIMALGQDHRAGYTHPRSAGIRAVLTMTGAGKIDRRLLLKSVTAHV
jgi:acyl-CoA synthetase (AMP-forming)/AMP-acid ligase II